MKIAHASEETSLGAPVCAPGAWPKVAIIVLNWNGWRDTVECLESLQRISYPDYQVIVVDNGSTDESVAKIKSWASGELPVLSRFFAYDPAAKPVQWVEYTQSQAEAGGDAGLEAKLIALPPKRRLVIVRIADNLGFAGGNNVALRYVLKKEVPLILLLNNDTVVHPDFLTHLVAALQRNPTWWAAGPKILYKDEPARIWYAGARILLWRASAVHLHLNELDGYSLRGVRSADHVSMCCFLGRKELFEEAGLLDEDFFFGHEDWAYSCAARKRGMSFGVNLDAVVYHKSGGSHSSGHPAYVYYYNKNRLLTLKKHGSFLDRICGYSFYFLTRCGKFPRLLVAGRSDSVRAEIRAIADFVAGRYGDYDRRRANARENKAVGVAG